MNTITQNTIIEKLIAKGFTKEQAEGFIDALQDSDLAKQVNELTNTILAVVAIDTVADLLF